MATAFTEVADIAEGVAAEQKQLARDARALDRQQRRGASWRQLTADRSLRNLFDLLASSTKQLLEVTGLLRTAAVTALAHEGMSLRQIASRLGVSHQRLSAIRRRRR